MDAPTFFGSFAFRHIQEATWVLCTRKGGRGELYAIRSSIHGGTAHWNNIHLSKQFFTCLPYEGDGVGADNWSTTPKHEPKTNRVRRDIGRTEHEWIVYNTNWMGSSFPGDLLEITKDLHTIEFTWRRDEKMTHSRIFLYRFVSCEWLRYSRSSAMSFSRNRNRTVEWEVREPSINKMVITSELKLPVKHCWQWLKERRPTTTTKGRGP